MTNGIRKVRKGDNIFDKRILDSCKFISDSASEYSLVLIFSLQPAEYNLVSQCMVHNQDSNTRFTEFLSVSRVYRVLVSIQGLQSSCLYPRFTELLSLSKVYRVLISIQGLQSSCLYPGFTELLSLSKVYRVLVSIQGLQSSCLHPGFTE